MKKNEIFIIEGNALTRMAYELCRKAALSDMISEKCGSQDARIRIKPNLLGPVPAEDGATTHPQIVEGIIEYLRDSGFQDLAVMESSWVGDRTSDSVMVTGFDELCRRLEVPFMDLQEDSGIRTDGAGMELNVCRRALETDFLINVPVMKGHSQTGMTCALKNMKGCIPASEKRRFHRLGLHDPIGHLSAAIHQDFILADAICPDLTFEDGGSPTVLNRMLCAKDPVLLDAYVCGILGIPVEDVKYIQTAGRCGVGDPDAAHSDVYFFRETAAAYDAILNGSAGTEKDSSGYTVSPAPAVPWTGSASRTPVSIKEKISEIDSCSACYAALLPALSRLEAEGALEQLNENICIGQGYRGKTGAVGIGNCTAGFTHSLKGCPPETDEIYSFLRGLNPADLDS